MPETGPNYSSTRLMRVFLEDVVKSGRLDLIDEMSNIDMIDEANLAFGGPPGRDGLIAHVKGFRRNITEREISIQRIVGNETEVMAWWSFAGNHSGPWLGVAPTNEPITGTVFSFFTLRNDRIQLYKLWLHATLNPPVTFDSSAGSPIS